jgi:PAS domain S-box-containing protein
MLSRLDSRAGRIAAGYAVFASLWILLSDHVLALLIPDTEMLVRFSVYKGVAFVAITAVLLFAVLRRVFGALEGNYESLRAHEAIARDERQFSDTMIESMPGVLYFYNEAGGFLRWNRNFETVTGYSGAEIAQMHPLQFFPPEEQPRLAERIAEVFSRGISSVEAPFQARDGRVTPYFFTGSRVMFNGRPCLVGVGIDISERKQAELALQQGERRYRTTLDNILEGCQLLKFATPTSQWWPGFRTQSTRPRSWRGASAGPGWWCGGRPAPTTLRSPRSWTGSRSSGPGASAAPPPTRG